MAQDKDAAWLHHQQWCLTGAGCKTGEEGSAAGAVENGMPASKHQEEVLRADDKATRART